MLTNEQRIGLFFIVGLVLLFIAIELTLGLGFLRRRYPLYAAFPDVQGLDVGADVRLAGLHAGRVDAMQIEGDHVRVKLAIDGGFEVKKDSVARLDFRALSGERYLSLTLGTPTAKAAQAGDTLQGETPASFSDAVDKLASVADSINDLTENLNVNSQRLLGSLADVVEENRTALGSLTQGLASVTQKLDRGTGTLGLLVNDPALYERANAALGDVRQSAEDLGKVAHDLTSGRSTLGKLMTEDNGLYAQVQEAVDNLNVAARNAQEISDDLRSGQGTLGKVLADDTLYNESIDTLRTANRAAQSVEDQAPISLLGTIVTSLF
jgi:phospholipid/cholesterol/gamma-HCH transport system substrate-binding protein